ncbi:hypothetical protein GCM10010406_32560 [Streptomyces thermolineatus]|uniref:Uncharacterized protein n=1 Tax=Streptomyces thermolineatus TaxID=44033 RepID=A0ABN3M1V4_9ACTN
MSYPAVPPQPGSHTVRFGGFRAGAGVGVGAGAEVGVGAGEARRTAAASAPPPARLVSPRPAGRTTASNTLSE